MKYEYFISEKAIIASTLTSLKALYENENSLYYQINNILSYAEKDNDFMSVSSFVDHWIALESIIKLSEEKNGFDGAIYYIPKALAVQYFRKDLNAVLKYYKCSVEDFAVSVCNKDESRFVKAKNPYVRYRLHQYFEILSDKKKFVDTINEIESGLSNDLMRIYIIRNEYVHASNIRASNTMEKYKVKRLLSDFLDTFFKSLHAHIKNEHYKVSGANIFSDILKRYNTRSQMFRVLRGEYKLDGKLYGLCNLTLSTSYDKILANIILDRVFLLIDF